MIDSVFYVFISTLVFCVIGLKCDSDANIKLAVSMIVNEGGK